MLYMQKKSQGDAADVNQQGGRDLLVWVLCFDFVCASSPIAFLLAFV